MTQNTPDKNEAAEERTEDTRRFVRQVRTATRRKYTSEEKIRIVPLEGVDLLTGYISCRVTTETLFTGLHEFFGPGVEVIRLDTFPTTQLVDCDLATEALQDNTDLKQMVAELSLELHRLKKTAIPMLDEGRTSA